MLLRILGISLLTLLLSSSVAGARSVETSRSARTSSGAVTLDFVDVALSEVARTLSLAYGTSILTDDAGDVRVTFHLEGVSLFEGLTSLCAAHGLDVVQEGRVYHIRRSRVQNGSIVLSDSGVVVDVKNMNVREFVKEFGLNTGVNVLADYDVDGVVSGNLRGMVPEMAFRVLMESNGFKVRGERGCLRVSRAKAGNGGKALNGSPDGAEVSVERAGDLYSVDLQSASLKSVLKAIAEEAGLNLAVYGDLNETVQMSFKDVSLPELLASLFRGSAFTFRLDSSSLWVSEEGAKALADVQVFPLKHVSPAFEVYERIGTECFGISRAECTGAWRFAASDCACCGAFENGRCAPNAGDASVCDCGVSQGTWFCDWSAEWGNAECGRARYSGTRIL